jgi:hypothetical protein
MAENLEHKCEQMPEDMTIYLDEDFGWIVHENLQDCGIAINFCPFCGKDLNE